MTSYTLPASEYITHTPHSSKAQPPKKRSGHGIGRSTSSFAWGAGEREGERAGYVGGIDIFQGALLLLLLC